MRTAITFVLLSIILSCNAQLKFTSDNPKDMRTLADSIVSNAKRTYKFSSETPIKDSYVIRIRYVNVADTTDRLNVFYSTAMKGANQALEIVGTPEYKFHSAMGKFLDLFPFWKKFIEPESNAESASQQLNDATINGKSFYLQEYSGQWSIRMQ